MAFNMMTNINLNTSISLSAISLTPSSFFMAGIYKVIYERSLT